MKNGFFACGIALLMALPAWSQDKNLLRRALDAAAEDNAAVVRSYKAAVAEVGDDDAPRGRRVIQVEVGAGGTPVAADIQKKHPLSDFKAAQKEMRLVKPKRVHEQTF